MAFYLHTISCGGPDVVVVAAEFAENGHGMGNEVVWWEPGVLSCDTCRVQRRSTGAYGVWSACSQGAHRNGDNGEFARTGLYIQTERRGPSEENATDLTIRRKMSTNDYDFRVDSFEWVLKYY